jgi:hypothetical protein
MCAMAAAFIWFLVAQAAAILPAFEAGAELRLVSPDLLTVYSSGRVVDDRLVIDLPLAAATELRLLVFPPRASDAAVAQVLSGSTAVYGYVADDRSDIMVRFPGTTDHVSLRAWLRTEHGITLVLAPGRSQ